MKELCKNHKKEYIYVHEDVMGTGVYYTRPDTGYVLNRHDYDVWGYNTKAPSYNYDPDYRATEPYFTGHPYDGALNLYYAHNRFYDAQTGQWLSEDPIKSGLNWYQYCKSNPTSYVDVLGLSEEFSEGRQSGKESNTYGPEPEAEVYIFFQAGMHDGVPIPTKANQIYQQEDYDLIIEELKEPFEGKEVKVIPINNKEEFIDAWKRLPDETEAVVIYNHATEEGFIFDEKVQTSLDTYEVTKQSILSVEEIPYQLDYKNIGVLYNLGCNTYGYHEKEEHKDNEGREEYIGRKEEKPTLAETLQGRGGEDSAGFEWVL